MTSSNALGRYVCLAGHPSDKPHLRGTSCFVIQPLTRRPLGSETHHPQYLVAPCSRSTCNSAIRDPGHGTASRVSPHPRRPTCVCPRPRLSCRPSKPLHRTTKMNEARLSRSRVTGVSPLETQPDKQRSQSSWPHHHPQAVAVDFPSAEPSSWEHPTTSNAF